MTHFNWLGGNLSLASSWGPQPDPSNPVVPGTSDDVTFPSGGTLVGALDVSFVNFIGGSFDMQGAITAQSSINFSTATGSTETDLTIETGASFSALYEQVGGFAAAKIIQSGGTNSAPGIGVNLGSYELDGGLLTIGVLNEYVGDATAQVGSFTQKDGTNAINGELIIGQNGTGTYTLTGGTLSSVGDYIGQNSTGTFVQTGGTQTVSDRIVLGINLVGTAAANGTGSYTLGGNGSLSVNTVFIGSDPGCTGTFNFNQDKTDAATLQISGTEGYPGLIVGGEGTGTFTHGHGSLNTTLVLGRLSTGNGTYNFLDGILTSTDEEIGGGGKGTFVQTNGTNTVNGTGLVVGSQSTAIGIYNLNNGTLIAVSETIGDQGNGTLNQIAGTNTVTGTLIVGNVNGGNNAYTLGTTGALVANGNVTLGSQTSSNGTFNYNITAGDAATFTMAQNQTLTVGGAGTGMFVHGGGQLTTILDVGAQAGGNGTYQLLAGALTAPHETIGDAGTGTFTHTLGNNTITTGDLIIGNASGGNGTYTLSGGALDVQTGGVTLGSQANATGTFNFNTAPGDAAEITIGSQLVTVGDAGNGTLTVGGGTLEADLLVASQVGSTGTVALNGGALTSAGQTIGDAGSGKFTQNGGTNTVTTNGLTVGNSSGGSGTYTLGVAGALDIQGGDLILANAGNSTGTFNFNITAGDTATLTIETGVIQVGFHGTASFNQMGGDLTAKVIVGSQVGSHGKYELGGGTLSSLGQVVGNDGTGTFKQDGGINTIAGGGDLILGSFSLGFGTYKLNGGQLVAGGEIVGNDGLGSFVQKGGSNTVNGGTTAVLALGLQFDGSGAYEIDTGTLNVGTSGVAGQEIVGDAGTGNFIQKGGANTITNGSLQIGVSNTGSYIISGGNLIVQTGTQPMSGDIVLGGSVDGFAGGTGTVAVSGGGEISVGNDLVIWQGSTVSVLDAQSGIDIGGSSAQTGDIRVEATNNLFGDGVIDAAVVDKGSIVATNNGTFSASNGGTLEITGSVSGSGTLILAAGATLRLDGSVNVGNSVFFNNGAPEKLILDQPGTGFANSIGNLNAGDVIEFGNGMTITAASTINAGTVEVDFHGPLGIPGTYDLTNVNFGSSAPRTFVTGHDGVTGLDFIAVTCFVAGTRISTERGDVAVEQLRAGDRTQVVLGNAQPIVWIGHRQIDCTRHARPRTVWPVRVAAGAFGPGRPRRDLWLSPDHAVFVDDVLIPIKYLVNGTSIAQVPVDHVTYYHVELPRHDVLLAEGLPTESYLDVGDRSNFTNGGGPITLYPDFASRIWEAAGCAPLVVVGPKLDAARQWLNAIADDVLRPKAASQRRRTSVRAAA